MAAVDVQEIDRAVRERLPASVKSADQARKAA
jgi:hypothetical protein